jgi:hypothetical protein
MAKTFILKLTSAIVIDGAVCRAGELVEVGELEAKNFLARGKAELATVEDGIEDDQANPDADDDLMKKTKAELLVIAAEKGAEATDGMTKAQIVAAINATEDKE